MKIKSLEIHFLHSLVSPHQLHGRVAVPIDILRASTTIITAMANGCKSIHPFATIEEAKNFKTQQGADQTGNPVLCGGERAGKIIDGFDLGNSPLEYGFDSVNQRTIAFSTTNGTKTIRACKNADRIYFGAFVNLRATIRKLLEFETIALVCAGTDGEMTSEDILFAGAVAETLCGEHGFKYANMPSHLALNIARTFWQTANRQSTSGQSLAEVLKMTRGGRNLVDIGFDNDIEFAAEIDKFDCVPILSATGIVLS